MESQISYNGRVYKIIALTETNGPSMTGPNIEVRSCVAQWLYKGTWRPVKNYELRAKLREIYDARKPEGSDSNGKTDS